MDDYFKSASQYTGRGHPGIRRAQHPTGGGKFERSTLVSRNEIKQPLGGISEPKARKIVVKSSWRQNTTAQSARRSSVSNSLQELRLGTAGGYFRYEYKTWMFFRGIELPVNFKLNLYDGEDVEGFPEGVVFESIDITK